MDNQYYKNKYLKYKNKYLDKKKINKKLVGGKIQPTNSDSNYSDEMKKFLSEDIGSYILENIPNLIKYMNMNKLNELKCMLKEESEYSLNKLKCSLKLFKGQISTYEPKYILEFLLFLYSENGKKIIRNIPELLKTPKVTFSIDIMNKFSSLLNNEKNIKILNKSVYLLQVSKNNLYDIAVILCSGFAYFIYNFYPNLLCDYKENNYNYELEILLFLYSENGKKIIRNIPELLKTPKRTFSIDIMNKFSSLLNNETNIKILNKSVYLLQVSYNNLYDIAVILCSGFAYFIYNFYPNLLCDYKENKFNYELICSKITNNILVNVNKSIIKNIFNINFSKTYKIDDNGKSIYNTKTYIMDEDTKSEWINAQCTPDAKILGKFILDITRHVTYTEFQSRLLESIYKIPQGTNKKYVIFIQDYVYNKKSNLWIASILIDKINKLKLKINIFDIVFLTDENYEQKILIYSLCGNYIDYIICDDGSYTGTQLLEDTNNYIIENSIDKFTNKIYLLVPFISSFAEIKLKNLHENIILLNSDKIETVMERAQLLNISTIKVENKDLDIQTQYIELATLLNKYFPNFYDNHSYDLIGSMPFYFDHKIADYISSFPSIYEYGIVKPKGECNSDNKNIMLIKNCDKIPTINTDLINFEIKCIIPYYKTLDINIIINNTTDNYSDEMKQFLLTDIGSFININIPKLIMHMDMNKLDNLISLINNEDIDEFKKMLTTFKGQISTYEPKYILEFVFFLYSENGKRIIKNIPEILKTSIISFSIENMNNLSELLFNEKNITILNNYMLLLQLSNNYLYDIGIILCSKFPKDILVDIKKFFVTPDITFSKKYKINDNGKSIYNTKTYMLNKNKKCEWINAQCNPNAKILGRFILDITRHVTYTEFQSKLLESIYKIPTNTNKKYVIFVQKDININNKKSNLWVTSILIDKINKINLKINIFDIVYSTDINYKKKITIYSLVGDHIDYIICDDGSFSGGQLIEDIDKYIIQNSIDNFKNKIYLLVPFISSIAEDKLKNLNTNMILLNSDKIETVMERAKLLNISTIKVENKDLDIQKEHEEIAILLNNYFPNLRENFSYNLKSGSMPFYFDHKIADYVSSFPTIYQFGIIKSEGSCNPDNILLIDNCDNDKPPYDSLDKKKYENQCVIPYYKTLDINIVIDN